MEHRVRIGLEIHVELNTASKLFCRCAAVFGEEPNTMVCPVCLGHPGTLPVLNRRAVELAVTAALALQCQVNRRSRFDRKNYFYPDLPKGYQLTQYFFPLARGGRVEFATAEGLHTVSIQQVHIEEDAARLYHRDDCTLVDCNRAGIALAEIVTAPELKTPGQARACLEELRAILAAVGVSDCRMEAGSLRCDANISLAGSGRVEIKNLNSFRALERALDYEIGRQARLLERGIPVTENTVRWDEKKQVTVPMRLKEGAGEYRYLPEPDLPPLVLERQLVEDLARELPPLPRELARRLEKQYSLTEEQARLLATDREQAVWFEEMVAAGAAAGEAAKWLLGPVAGYLKRSGGGLADANTTPSRLAKLILLQEQGIISGSAARQLLSLVMEEGGEPEQVVARLGLAQVSDQEQIGRLVEQVLASYCQAADDYRAGKDRALDFLLGKVMQLSRGKANPALASSLLKQKLGEKGD